MRSNLTCFMLLLGTTLGWVGCSGNHVPPPVADAAAAADTLKLTLDAWKSGATPGSLSGQSPSIHAVDDDWQAGQQLMSFQLLDNDTANTAVAGVAARIFATLELLGPSGNNRKIVQYLVRTSPTRSVVRYDNEPESE